MSKLKENLIFRTIIIIISVSLCFFGQFIPSVNGFSSSAFGVIFIFLGTLILWLTISIDWPSLLLIFSLGLIPELKFGDIFKNSFGNSTFLFLLFTFIATYALSKTGFVKRTALMFLNTKLAKKNSYFFIFLFLFAVLFLGLFISPTVLFVIVLPLAKEILKVGNIDSEDKISKMIMLGLGFTVSISSGMTTIAHVFPVLAMDAAGVEVSPLAYMGVAIPVGLLIFICMLLIFAIFIKIDKTKLSEVNINDIKSRLPKIDKKDIIILITFIIVVLLWILPSIIKDFAPDFYNIINGYTTAMPPLLGVIVLSIIKIDNKPIVKIDDALKNGVPWGSLIMCAATLALGYALKEPNIGIEKFLSLKLNTLLINLNPILILIIFVSWAALQTNVSSNMVTATLVASVAGTVLGSLDNSKLILSLVIVLIGMNASFAFATPPSMPHIAIVAGSEYATTKDVLIYGGSLMIISIIVSLLVGYPLGMLFY